MGALVKLLGQRRALSADELLLLALVGGLGAVGQFCQVRAYAAGELMAVAPIDYSRLIFAGVMGFLLFAELPERYTLVGAAIIVGSTLYIAYRETHLSRMHRAALAARPIAPHPEEADVPEPIPQGFARRAPAGALPTEERHR
jgi:drug/metabolite transporter (DMT)-like permease